MKYTSGEKYEIIRMVESSDLSVRRTLQQIDISKSTFYDWYGRYCEDGIEGLKDRKRTPKQFWNAIPESEKDKIVDVALQFPEKSCREIAFKKSYSRAGICCDFGERCIPAPNEQNPRTMAD
jgi:transposase-like protein